MNLCFQVHDAALAVLVGYAWDLGDAPGNLTARGDVDAFFRLRRLPHPRSPPPWRWRLSVGAPVALWVC